MNDDVVIVSLTDQVLVAELRERIERGSPLAPEEWEYLQRVLDKLELDTLQVAGFPREWL
jgi:hypothetical protein